MPLPTLDYYDEQYRKRKANEPVASITAIDREITRMRSAEIRENLFLSASPDTVARVNRVARETGELPLLVEDRIDSYEKALTNEKFLKVAQENNGVGKWAVSNPRAAAAAADDWESLAKFGKVFQDIKDDFLKDGGWFEQGGDFVERRAHGLLAGFDRFTVASEKFFERLTPESKRTESAKKNAEIVIRKARSRAEFGEKVQALPIRNEILWQEIKKNPSAGNVATFIRQQGFASLPDLAVAATSLPIYTVGRSGEIGQQRAVNSGRDEANFGDVTVAAPFAAISGYLERLGLSKMILPGASSIGVRIGKAAITEGGTEFAQEVIEYGGETIGTNAQFSATEALDRGFAGAVGGAGMGVTVRSVVESPQITKAIGSAVANMIRRDKAVFEGSTLDMVVAESEKSKLKTRDPEAFRSLLESLAGENEVENVYISGEALKEYMQSDAYEPSDALSAWLNEVEEASATGGDVVMPIAEAAITLGPIWQNIKDDVRLSAGGMTRKEANAFDEAMADVMDELATVMAEQDKAESQVKTEREALASSIIGKLQNAGFTPSTARTQAELLVQRYATRMARLGRPLTGNEFDAVTVNQVLPEGLQAARKADQLDLVINSYFTMKNPKAETGKSLVEWIAERGGVTDEGGDLKSMGLDQWHRGKFKKKAIRKSAKGQGEMLGGTGVSDYSPDRVLVSAIEAGYFPELDGSEIDANVLLEAIGTELQGQPRYAQERIVDDVQQLASEMESYLAQAGYDPSNMSREEMRAAVLEAQDAQEGGYEQLPDTIEIDGVERPTMNSLGNPIARDEAGVRAFWKWFSDSKVVDEQGRPLVVYHGTTADFESFDNKKTGSNDRGLWGRGHYFSAKVGAPNSYALRQGDGAQIIPAYVSLQAPLVLKTGDDFVTRLPDGSNSKELVGPNLDGAKIKEIAQNDGGDGVLQIIRDGSIGDLVAYSPEQIKSVNNRGTFDASDPRILFQSGSGLPNSSANQGLAQSLAADAKLLGDVTQSPAFRDKGLGGFDAPSRAGGYEQATIEIDGVERPTQNSNGQPLAQTEEGLRNFYAWFGDSKVVDAEGRPLVVYHGTTGDIDAFRGMAWGAADVMLAREYAIMRQGMNGPDVYKNILPIYMKIERIFDADNLPKAVTVGSFFNEALEQAQSTGQVIDTTKAKELLKTIRAAADREESGPHYDRHNFWNDARSMFGKDGSDAIAEMFRELGFDGVQMRESATYGKMGEPTYGAFSPTQIKSVNNRGTFDPTDARILYQSAFHGSPHIFDKFSLDKIGTGEGAQAYGWGLYFAGRKEIAEHYREVLSAAKRRDGGGFEMEYRIGGKVINRSNPVAWKAADMAVLAQENEALIVGDYGSVIKWARSNIAASGLGEEQSTAVFNAFQKYRKQTIDKSRVSGRLYKVEIPDDDEYLLWDKPLSEQPAKVKAALAKIGNSPGDYEAAIKILTDDKAKASGRNLASGWHDQEIAKREMDLARANSKTGAEYYREVGAYHSDKATYGKKTDERASLTLLKAGIAGIKYLDGGSRSDGDGSYNYVVFDDSRVSIEAYEQSYEEDVTVELASGGIFNVMVGGERAGTISIAKGGNGDFVDLANLNPSFQGRRLGHSAYDAIERKLGRKLVPSPLGLSANSRRFWVRRFDKMSDTEKADALDRSKAAGLSYGVPEKDIDERLSFLTGRQAEFYQNTDISGNQFEQSYEDNARGKITFADGQATIDLFKTRNLSTFLHETGHLWLEELAFDASLPEAPQQLKDDWQTVQDWFSSQGHKVENGMIPTDAHEMWARGVERYLMEGKSPIGSLKRIFETFKAWLTAIYKTVDALKSPITPEVREVMDRLIATDEQIQDIAEQQKVEAVFKDAAEAGMSDAEFQAYVKQTEDARSEAKGKLIEKVMRSIRSRETKAYRDSAQNVRDEIEPEVDARPLFKALRNLKEQPIDSGWLKEEMGEDAFRLLPRRRPAVYKDGGVHPDVIAEQSGFATGKAMVEALMGAEIAHRKSKEGGDTRSMRERTIQEEVSAIMQARYGDPLNDGSIEREALEVVHNDMQGEVIASEIRVLARRSGKRPTPYAIAKDWARNKIRSGIVTQEASPSAIQRYARAAQRSATAAQEAMLKQDVDEAFRHKQAQMLNNALVSEAKKAFDDVEGAVKRLEKVAKRKTMKSVDQDYLEQAQALLEAVDIRRRSQVSIDKQGKFEAWAREREAEGFDVVVPASFGEMLGTTNWTRLTVENLLGLDDAVKQIMHLGRLKQTLLDNKEQRDFDELVKEATDGMGNLRQKPPSDMMEPTYWDGIKSKILAADAALLKMETVFDWLDNKDSDGVFNRVVFRPIADAQENERLMLEEYITKLTDALKAVPRGVLKRWGDKVETGLLNRETGNPYILTREQLVSIALNVGNQSNLDKLTGGYGWNEGQVLSVLSQELTEAEWNYVQSVWDTIESLWPQIEAMEKRLNGVAPEKIEPRSVETPFGVLKGGYFPVVYDPRKNYDAEANAAKGRDLFETIYTRATTPKGFTKERTNVERPIHLSLGIINRHVSEVIHDLTHREAIMQADKFLSNRRIMKGVDDTLGPEVRRQFRPWLQRIANEWAYDRAGQAGIENILKQARLNTTIVGMGFRATTILMQLAGYSNSFERVGFKWVAKRLKDVGNPAAWDFVLSKSKEVAGRMNSLDRDIRDNIKDAMGKKRWLTAPKKFAFHGIAYMDRVVVVPTWLGAYDKALAEGRTEEDAIYAADRVVRQSQGAGAAKDLAAVQSGRGTAGEAFKLLTQFYSFMSAFYQRQRTFGRDVRNAKLNDAPALLARAWWLFIVPPVLAELLAGRGPDDDEDEALWAFEKIMLQVFGPIPIVRDVAPVALAKIKDEPTFGYKFTPVSGAMQSMINVSGDVSNIVEGEETKRATRNSIETVGYFTGLTTGQMAAAAQFLVDVSYGEQSPEDFADWWEGLTTGKIKEE